MVSLKPLKGRGMIKTK